MGGVRKRPHKETAKHALDPGELAQQRQPQAHCSICVLLGDKPMPCRLPFSLSFVASVLCRMPLAIDFLMDAATPPPPIPRFKGLSWNTKRRRKQGEVQESSSGSESPSCRRRLKFFHCARHGSNFRKSSSRRAITKRHA